ncbi:aspartyl-phosphate phosphatase Spo0E family protein [Haloimpatiens lingqiaonensis]|uniref:aspartyl-phosphate phosphatase Spo0E family protein n=1 Tax=Haloimpatiens lingqiaonensis TaxID=1380675 RepID=UPI0037BEF98C
MNFCEEKLKLKKQISILQDKLNNSVLTYTNDNLGTNNLILKASMELDELINLYMDLLNKNSNNDY